MKIGIFSTFVEEDALTLVRTVQDAVKSGQIPQSEISFVFSNRMPGESRTTDRILTSLQQSHTPTLSVSVRYFKPDLRKKGKEMVEKGEPELLERWRDEYGKLVHGMLPKTDIDVLLGDMYIWGRSLYENRRGINLHPALPGGPKGMWDDVIWQLIENSVLETGVMMHKVTGELDRGPAVTYCRFSLRDGQFANLWNELPNHKNKRKALIDTERALGIKSVHPLFRKIRNEGLMRETPLILATLKSFAEGAIRFEGNQLVDGEGRLLAQGYDLSSQIDFELRGIQREGITLPGKEREL